MLPSLVTLSSSEATELRTARIIMPVDDAVFRVEGSGTFACLQGLLTNDVAKLPNHAAVWGAFLTAKGMIISDAWVIRDGDAAFVVVPRIARDPIRELFTRTMPPRLAKVADRSDEMGIRWACGGTATNAVAAIVANPVGPAPFASLLLTTEASDTDAALVAQGWTVGPPVYADALKVLAGWPTLGREIDEKTLPQEVRFDELEGVKYDKGCYTGQETVARLHFRGHANRWLGAVRWPHNTALAATDITMDGKSAGTIRSVAQFGRDVISLAMLRKEVGTGASVRHGDVDGVVIAPPVDLESGLL